MQANRAQEPVSRDSLPELLVSQGKVPIEKIRAALRKQAETGEFFGDVLAEEGTLDEQSLVKFLARHCKIPHVSLLDYLIDKSIINLIPADVCWKYHLLPLDKMGRNLTVAMVNPLNNEAIAAVEAICPNLRIKPILCTHNHFETVAGRLFGEQEDHDEQTWAHLPFSVAEPVPEAPPAQAGDPPPPPVKEAPDTASSLTKDALLDSVFGIHAPTFESDEKEEDAPASEPVAHEPVDTVKSIMHRLTNVMLDSMHDTYELLARRIQLFSGLNAEDVSNIFSHGNVVEYEQNQVVFEKAAAGDRMYVILNGRVEIRDGNQCLAILQRGEMFGEMALLSREPRIASASTLAPTSLLALSEEDIRKNLPSQVSIQILINILTTLSQRLRIANTQ